MHPIDVFNMHQPFIEQRQIGALSVKGGANAAAIIVTADDDVRNFEHLHGVLDDAEAVEVGGDHLIGDVAVRENGARQRVDDDVGRHAAVRAANPQEFGLLIGRETLEIAGIALTDFLGPGFVLKQQFFEGFHKARFSFSRRLKSGLCDSDVTATKPLGTGARTKAIIVSVERPRSSRTNSTKLSRSRQVRRLVLA